VGDGDLDHDYWGRPEEMTMSRPVKPWPIIELIYFIDWKLHFYRFRLFLYLPQNLVICLKFYSRSKK
jgi:hypothetical protein